MSPLLFDSNDPVYISLFVSRSSNDLLPFRQAAPWGLASHRRPKFYGATQSIHIASFAFLGNRGYGFQYWLRRLFYLDVNQSQGVIFFCLFLLFLLSSVRTCDDCSQLNDELWYGALGAILTNQIKHLYSPTQINISYEQFLFYEQIHIFFQIFSKWRKTHMAHYATTYKLPFIEPNSKLYRTDFASEETIEQGLQKCNPYFNFR